MMMIMNGFLKLFLIPLCLCSSSLGKGIRTTTTHLHHNNNNNNNKHYHVKPTINNHNEKNNQNNVDETSSMMMIERSNNETSVEEDDVEVVVVVVPENDHCGDSTMLEIGSLALDTTTNAHAGGKVQCRDPNRLDWSNESAPGIWYSFIGTGVGIRVFTCTDEDDTTTLVDADDSGHHQSQQQQQQEEEEEDSNNSNNNIGRAGIMVYRGGCAHLQCVSVSHASPICEDTGEVASFFGEEGVLYHILIASTMGANREGPFQLTVQETHELLPQDTCEMAVPINETEQMQYIEGQIGYPVSSIDFNIPESCSEASVNFVTSNLPESPSGLWYTLIGTGHRVVVEPGMCSYTEDGIPSAYGIAILTGEGEEEEGGGGGGGCQQLTCVVQFHKCIDMQDMTTDTTNGDLNPEDHRFLFNTIRGQTYYFLVLGVSPTYSTSTPFSFRMGVVPRNNHCQRATELSLGSLISSSTELANVDRDHLGVLHNARSVWYSVTMTGSGLQAYICGLSSTVRKVKLDIFMGDCNNLIHVTKSKASLTSVEFCGTSTETVSGEAAHWFGTTGQIYYILVQTTSVEILHEDHFIVNDYGPFQLVVQDIEGTPSHDVCENAITVNGTHDINGILNMDATLSNVTTDTNQTAVGVWFQMTGNGTTVEYAPGRCEDDSARYAIAVFQGDNCQHLTAVNNPYFCSTTQNQQLTSFLAEEHKSYKIFVFTENIHRPQPSHNNNNNHNNNHNHHNHKHKNDNNNNDSSQEELAFVLRFTPDPFDSNGRIGYVPKNFGTVLFILGGAMVITPLMKWG